MFCHGLLPVGGQLGQLLALLGAQGISLLGIAQGDDETDRLCQIADLADLFIIQPAQNTVTEHGTVTRGVCESTPDGYLANVTERTKIEKGVACPRFTEDDGATWTDLPADTIVSMNMWGFHKSYLEEAWKRFPAFLDNAIRTNPMKGEYFLPAVVSQLLEEKRARVRLLSSHDKWYGVTYKEDKPVVVAALASMREQGLYPKNLWK